jgi:hypothetical protein
MSSQARIRSDDPLGFYDKLDRPPLRVIDSPTPDPGNVMLANAINDLVQVFKENIQWQQSLTRRLMANSPSGLTPKSTDMDGPSTGFDMDTADIRRARKRLSQNRKA